MSLTNPFRAADEQWVSDGDRRLLLSWCARFIIFVPFVPVFKVILALAPPVELSPSTMLGL